MALDIEIRDLVEEAGITQGSFDVLMTAVNKHLEDQYMKTRITGNDYANVYLGALQAALSQAIQYTLGMRTANAQAALYDAQAATEAQRLLTEIENTALTTEQKNLILAQISKTNAETTLLGQKNLTEIQETSKRTQEVTLVTNQAALVAQQDLTEIQNTQLVQSQRLKVDAEELLVDQKTLTEVQETARVTAETSKLNAEKLLVDANELLTDQKTLTEVEQTLRVTAETTLLTWKAETEHAQTVDTLMDNITAVAGVVAKQKTLYERQADGFLRDAEQKLSKIVMDSWAVQRSTDSGTSIPTQASNTSIDAILDKAAAGIGV